jgi:NAD(P)-dependent dehydrogenase (short-subunit alcohol dehydrogenase family)
LDDLESVARTADEMLLQLDKIDVLINSAGIHYGFHPSTLFSKETASFTTKQGYDKSFVTNFLSHVLLTEKLAPLLKVSDRPKVVQISRYVYQYQYAADAFVSS